MSWTQTMSQRTLILLHPTIHCLTQHHAFTLEKHMKTERNGYLLRYFCFWITLFYFSSVLIFLFKKRRIFPHLYRLVTCAAVYMVFCVVTQCIARPSTAQCPLYNHPDSVVLFVQVGITFISLFITNHIEFSSISRLYSKTRSLS